MDYEAYAEGAVELVNLDLDSVATVQALVRRRGWERLQARPRDLAELRKAQDRLAVVVDRSAAGDAAAVVREVNALLLAHPIRPQVAGHDARNWHLHVHDGGTVAETLIGEAIFGLAFLITELGADRLGRCEAPGCDRAYLDTSSNRSRRYCGTRCATRVNVAAHRRRQAAQSKP
ncbi:CGNR zinc finger domain-containing protein [Labedaea rhizosphaerae]|uniref:CGNR zinc finger protein n=1 Tax=Labedaea rhizosphaerae TaxID=598644 RepID=A0A4R6SBF9_LABRH|nr:CGNR zinc finger domain-containing protein [Labedaea rhizosphaerae]TDP96797.1 CGNR zinc finger protein [Labedaea rhizosphaerae]